MRTFTAALLALALIASSACDGPSDDGAAAHARAALARDGFTELELTPVSGSPGRFAFEGQNEGFACHGEVLVGGSGERRTAAISSRCPQQN